MNTSPLAGVAFFGALAVVGWLLYHVVKWAVLMSADVIDNVAAVVF